MPEIRLFPGPQSMYTDLQRKIDKAVDIRERGDLDKSRKLFDSLVEELNTLIRRDSSNELKNFYIQTMGEYVIQYRLEGKNSYFKALDLGKKLLEFDKRNKINNPASYRSVSNVLINIGSFEEAIDYLKMVAKLFKDNSGRQGDALSHLAYCHLRSGNVAEASGLIDESLKNINKNTKNEEYAPVWLSRALMFKSYILFAKGNVNKALKCSKDALKIAQENNLPIRIRQSKDMVKFFKSKI